MRCFPAPRRIASLMASFAAFAAGYLARPIGGIVLSHYGDRYGRRAVFLWSVFVMSGATLGMGLVPSYAQWGVAASALMVLLRLVQGFCLGGELPGALTYVVETAPQDRAVGMRRGLRVRDDGRGGGHGSQPLGSHLPRSGDGAALRVAHRLRAGRPWRRAQLRAAPINGGIAGVRAHEGLASRQPFGDLLRTHTKQVLVGCAVLAGTGCFNGLFFSICPPICRQCCSTTPVRRCFSQTVGVLASAGASCSVGWLGERIPPRYLLRAGVGCCWLASPSRSTARSNHAR